MSTDTTGSGASATLEKKVETLHTRIKRLEEARNEDKKRIWALETENAELREELATLKDRTDLFDRVERASALKPDERAAVLIQTLFNEASRGDGHATIDASGAVHALGGEVDRTLMYGESGAFQRAVELVDNQDVLWFQKESRASRKNSRLILDLNAGELPKTVAGRELREVPADAD